MRAVRSTPPGVAVVDVDEPDGAGELISIRSASICASDFGYIEMGSQFLLGHELAGTTEDGRAVAIEGIFGCGECDLCLEGRYNLCATTGTTALGVMADGGMSEWFRAPARSLIDLPEGLAVTDACLVEPTAVAWHSCRLAGAGPDRRVCVVGGGAIGLMAVAAARAMGAPEVSLEARYPHQIELGERLGATQPSAPRARCTAAPSWPRREARWACSACSVPRPPGRNCSAS
jgi:threonine dehydrogenase-like Zn-dependent dehydrogenase